MHTSFLLQKSPISGNGVFAATALKKGEILFLLEGEEIDLAEVIRRVNAGTENPSDPLQIDDERYIDLNPFSRAAII